MSEAAINNAYDATAAFFQTPEDRLKYLNRQMAIMDYNAGLESAEERGIDRLAKLISKLHDAGRDEEIVRAANDEVLREKLFQEFRL